MVTRLPDDQRTCGICGRLLSDHDSESDVPSEVSEGGIVEYVVTGIRGSLGDYKAVDDPTDSGPHHRSPRRYMDDRNRDLQWQRYGVPVARIAVEDLADDAALEDRLREEILRHLRAINSS